MTGGKKLHYPHFNGDCHGDADFSCPIITELRNFVVTLRMATLYKILIPCVGFALSTNLWAQSCRSILCSNIGDVAFILERKEASDETTRCK